MWIMSYMAICKKYSERGYEKKADAFAPAFFRTLCCLFIEGADPLKHPWVGLAPSEMPLV